MGNKIKLYLLLCLLISSLLHSAETDNYLIWTFDRELKDSSQIFNDYFNTEIDKVLDKVNGSILRKNCAQVAFKIGTHFNKGIEKMTQYWVEKTPKLDIFPPKNQSVPPEGYSSSLYRYSIHSPRKRLKNLSSTIKLNNVHLGSDKIAHSYGLGFLYYIMYNHQVKKQKFKNRFKRPYNRPSDNEIHQKAKEYIVNFGLNSEQRTPGFNLTGWIGQWKIISGVLSFADMEANYQGFRFYYSLCNKSKNKYGRPILPRLTQDEYGEWRIRGRGQMDISEYVNPNWDEAFNENGYDQEVGLPIVKENLKKYCIIRRLPHVKKMFARYRKYEKTYEQSYSYKLLERYRKIGLAQQPFSHEKFCKDEVDKFDLKRINDRRIQRNKTPFKNLDEVVIDFYKNDMH